jgi:hypothetical protein
LLEIGRILFLAEQAAAEVHRIPYCIESAKGQLLRYQSDQVASNAVVADNIVPGDANRARAAGDDAADDRNQGCFTGAIGAQQRENLALADVEIDLA